MSFRFKFSAILLILGFMALIMSYGGKSEEHALPEDILFHIKDSQPRLSPDEFASILAEQNSGFRILDLRSPFEYNSGSLPGAVNAPFYELFSEEYADYIYPSEDLVTLLYDTDGTLSPMACVLLLQEDIGEVKYLAGGMEEWNRIVMHTSFEGQSLSPAENAVFEKRFKARRAYTQWNALPDSLKSGFFAARSDTEKQLVGGCE